LQKTKKFENEILAFAKQEMVEDQAHDINHVLRVVNIAKQLCVDEKGKYEIVMPAAYLHDCFSFPKGHPDRSESSTFAAKKALVFLKSIGYPCVYSDGISQAIMAHSYSADIKPNTLEAKIVQDADRLDALGAIGIARCLQVSAKMGVALYNSEDAFCERRKADDRQFTIDHFYVKLLNLVDTMNTRSAKIEAQKRTLFMKQYLNQLAREL